METPTAALRKSASIQALCGLWSGLILGGSLIAASVKFRAPSLSLATGLEIGRVTFRAIGIVETLFALVILVLISRGRSRHRWLYSTPIVILLVQWLFLMPMLDARTVRIIEGQTVGPSNLHIAFITLEVLKCAWLAILAICPLIPKLRSECIHSSEESSS